MGKLVTASIALLVVTTVLAVPVAGVEAADLSVAISAPDTVTAGETVSIGATVGIPDLVGDYSSTLYVSLYVDGSKVSSKSVSVNDGETADLTFSHTFDSTGSKTVTVKASISIGGQSFSASSSTTVDVDPEPLGELDLSASVPAEGTTGETTPIGATVSLPDAAGQEVSGEITVAVLVDGEERASQTVSLSDGASQTVDLGVTFEEEGEHTVTIKASGTIAGKSFSVSLSRTIAISIGGISKTGAAFPVPESLEDEVNEYRQTAGVDDSLNAFVLATDSNLYLVFTQATPKTGRATVTGPRLEQNLSTSGFTIGGLAAVNTSFRTTGTSTSISAIRSNSDQYHLELVRVDSTYRRMATLTDPDAGQGVTFATTAGAVVESPRNAMELFEAVGQKARSFSIESVDSQPNPPLGLRTREQLPTFSFQSGFWLDAPATVDAIVIDPGSPAYRFMKAQDRGNLVDSDGSTPVLYVTEYEIDSEPVTDVSQLTESGEELDGEVVEVTANLYQLRVSAQESLEESTPCGKNQFPVKEVCVDIVQDELVHAGVAWESAPQSEDDTLFVLGLSSRHQDSPAELKKGQYRIIGEVISTSKINDSLPEGSVLVVYDLKRVGEIDYDSMPAESRALIENRSKVFSEQIQSQFTQQSPTDSDDGTGATATPRPTDAESTDGDGTPGTDSRDPSASDGGTDGTSDSDEPVSGTSGEANNPSTADRAESSPPATNTSSPGFGPFVTLVALLVVASLRRP